MTARRGSTITDLTSRNLPGKPERADTPSPKVVGPLSQLTTRGEVFVRQCRASRPLMLPHVHRHALAGA
jgi:hypothetical protein